MAVNWDRDGWGQPPHNIHIASDCPDKHTRSEDDAERRNG